MSTSPKPQPNVKQAVPFFGVSSMEVSLRFYLDGLGCTMKHQWIDEGKLRWCWLEMGNAALMLQEFRKEGHDSWAPKGPVGEGVSICFMCEDAIALYHEFKSRGVEAKRPFVGNRLWVTNVTDPDGYKLCFESPTEAPEQSEYTG
jgi:lactoylglutathione lyase